MKNRGLVIKSKFRFTIFIAVVIVMFVTVFNTAVGFTDATGSTEKQYIQVEVSAGDTLWDIANMYSSDNDDTRSKVHKICQINDIKASDLTSGMILDIPADL